MSSVILSKKIILVIGLLLIPLIAITYPFTYETCNLGYKHVHHKHNEESYQKAWCNAHGGVMEYENEDFTRVDCLTKTHAVEFDFADKVYESVGQALHYGIMTGKKPKVVLILDNPELQMVYYKRLEKIGKRYKIDIEYVSNDILNLDSEGKCNNPNCKCHKNNGATIHIQHNPIQRNIYYGE